MCDTDGVKRRRFSGDAEALAEVLQAFIHKPRFFVYGEKMDRSAVNPSMITPYRDLFQAIARVQGNLSLPQKLTEDALRLVYKAKKASPEWAMLDTDHAVDDWADVSARRLRTACRHIYQAQVKSGNNGTQWLRLLNLPLVKFEPTRDNAMQYVYGWDRELQKGWRADASRPASKEPCSTVSFPSSGDMARCEWSDGHIKDVYYGGMQKPAVATGNGNEDSHDSDSEAPVPQPDMKRNRDSRKRVRKPAAATEPSPRPRLWVKDAGDTSRALAILSVGKQQLVQVCVCTSFPHSG